MSMSATKAYFEATVFCLVFSLIYNHFGHGVTSFFMTGLCLWPLLGFIFSFLFRFLKNPPGRFSENSINAGIGTLGIASLLKGIFDIAGTASSYVWWIFAIGVLWLAMGIVALFVKRQ